MPSVSEKQHKYMQAIAHGWKPKKGNPPSKKVAQHFLNADQRMKKYAVGGFVGGLGSYLRNRQANARPQQNRMRGGANDMRQRPQMGRMAMAPGQQAMRPQQPPARPQRNAGRPQMQQRPMGGLGRMSGNRWQSPIRR